MNTFDAVVLGLGGMGSATLMELAQRGLSVVGIEQFPLVHAQGSSHGRTRIIRRAYYEHPDYVPLVDHSFRRWQDLESRLGRHLLTTVPCLTIGPDSGELILGVQRAADLHRLAIERLSANALHDRYPQFRLNESPVGILEADSGVLAVEDCVRAHLDAAVQLGATIFAEEPILGWESIDSRTITVRTTKRSISTRRLIITAGAWATELLRSIGVPLTIMRQTQHWFRSANSDSFTPDRFPSFLMEVPQGYFYGIPDMDGRTGVKVAQHFGAVEVANPSQVDWTPTLRDQEPISRFLSRHLPDLSRSAVDGAVCMYTLSPDRHFIIDRHPEQSNVWFATGFSGHGFKFAPVVGEILTDLAIDGTTSHPIEFLRLNRLDSILRPKEFR